MSTQLLLLASLVVAAFAALLWPGRGLLPRLRKGRRHSERVRLEDALKHLYMSERRGRTVTLEGLAGTLEISTGAAADLLSRLMQGGLAVAGDESPVLTDEGRRIAVQTVRTHRLWETWLADRTGVRAEEWHTEAERMEHRLSPEDADRLAARLGDPRYDPHGDPIPTARGELPPPDRVTLRNAPVGRALRVSHLEDEPPEVYQRLLDLDLGPGLIAEVVEREADHLRIRTPHGLHRIDPVAAGHVTVQVLPADAAVDPPRRTLDQAPAGETVRVVGIAPTCQGPQRRRLLDLGVVPGTPITAELVSAFRDPVAYRIRGALIGLRRGQARWILVESTDEEAQGGDFAESTRGELAESNGADPVEATGESLAEGTAEVLVQTAGDAHDQRGGVA